MKITQIIWLEDIVDKLEWKHHVRPYEVEEVLMGNPRIYFKEKGKHNPEENVYIAFGRTYSGRYLFIVFILKVNRRALIITARDMTKTEKKQYEKKQ